MYVSPTVSCAMSLREVLCALRSSEKVGRYFIILLLTSVIMCVDATRLPKKVYDLKLVGAYTPSQSDVTRIGLWQLRPVKLGTPIWEVVDIIQ